MNFKRLEEIAGMDTQVLSGLNSSELASAVRQLSTYLNDSLTGLRTRVQFLQGFDKIENNTALVLFDVDHFKKINDTYGHTMGDEVLKYIGQVMLRNSRSQSKRRTDSMRFGGEEFLTILPETSIENARIYAERIREEVYSHEFEMSPGQKFRVTLSAGVSHFDTRFDHTKDKRTMYSQADQALYRAKHSGRNQVCLYSGNGN